MTRKRALGKGLSTLLQSARVADEIEQLQKPASVELGITRDRVLREIPIEFLERGRYQPRRDMSSEALEELASSIRQQGVVQPIVVRPIGKPGEDRYEIIAGERRWRATQMAGVDRIPAVIRDVPDEAVIAMALIENIQREDLNPIEEAMVLARLKEEFNLTQQEIAEAVGKPRVTVTNLLRLLNLDADVRKMLEHGDIEAGHAKALLGLYRDRQLETARIVVGKGLSVRQTEALVRRMQQQEEAGAAESTHRRTVDPDIRSLEDDLSQKIGARVAIQHSAKGKGRLVIQYNSLDELDGVLAHIQ